MQHNKYTDKKLIGPDTDLKAFVSELKTPWKTMDSDMDTALGIITNHAKTEIELETTQLMTIIQLEGNQVSIEFPSWQTDVEKAFIHQYGLIEGKLIFNKVLMRLFQIAKGTEQQLH